MPKQTTGTPPRKRAPRKASPLTAVPTPADGDQPADSNGGGKKRPTIMFRGREIAVVRPEPEALSVWNRTGPKLEEARRRLQELKERGDEAGVEQAQARLMRLADRVPIIIHGVMADEADQDWLDEQFLADLKYDQAVDIVTMAIDQFRDPDPAPTAGPVRRARLRA